MKTALLIVFLFCTRFVYSQDRIKLKSGEELNVKVSEVGIDEIKYKKVEDGPQYILRKSEISTITYKDSSQDIFNVTKKDTVIINDGLIMQKAKIDAHNFYLGENSGAGGTFAASFFLSPVIGLIPAIACSSTPPRGVNLNIPRSQFSEDRIYIESYKREAHRIKSHKVWGSWAVCLMIYVAAGAILETAGK